MSEYQVLARKYRPKKLEELIGQDVLVKTIASAIEKDRLPHAFILTGIRGVGKTSTARIIARSLLCTGEKEESTKPTITPCGKCANCESISKDNHVDVIEVDAASRTGVNDIREIIDQVPYAPVMGRYKIYIIDEVHMLSKSAFNALLKTLEEPPSHVKFIFATTEIRKIPVTILSRCMRFDLPRVATDILLKHFEKISKLEEAKFDQESLRLIANASEGSVRDGLSLLDQAIAVSAGEEISIDEIQKMLGFADKEKIYELLLEIIDGKTEKAISLINSIYNVGVEPLTILKDIQEATHNCTMYFVSPNLFERKMLSEVEEKNIKKVIEKVNIAGLSRLWQIIGKGIEETKICSSPLIAAEMVIVKGCYSAALPTADEILKRFKGEPVSNLTSETVANSNSEKQSEITTEKIEPDNIAELKPSDEETSENSAKEEPTEEMEKDAIEERDDQTVDFLAEKKTLKSSEEPAKQENKPTENLESINSASLQIANISELTNLLRDNNEPLYSAWLEEIKIITFSAEEGLIEITEEDKKKCYGSIKELQEILHKLTEKNWVINIADVENVTEIKSVNQEKEEELNRKKQEAVESEKVKAILNNFEGSEIVSVKRVIEE